MIWRKMKIVFFLHSPNPFPGAQWTRIEFFADYFQQMGHSVTVVGAFSAASMNKAGLSKYNGFRILNITPIIMMANVFSLFFNFISSCITSFLPFVSIRPEIIIISVPTGETSFGPFLLAKLFRTKKIVIDYRDQWEDYTIKLATSRTYKSACKFLKKIMTRCYLKSNLVITVTPALADSLFHRGVKNVQIVTNGADITVFRPRDKAISKNKIRLHEHDFVIVYSGSLGVYYRLDIVLSALKTIVTKMKNVKLIVIGRGGASIEDFLDLADKLNLKDNVVFLGLKTDKKEIAEILSAADVGVIPYDANPLWKNSLPVKSLEYLACGVPILATVYTDSILARLILENGVGLVSAPENVEELAINIERVYRENTWITEAGKRSVSLVETQFDRNKIVKTFYDLLVKC